MSVLPIVDRELLVAARRKGTYWMRFWTALAVLAIWLILLTNNRQISTAQMGQHLLNGLGILALLFSMLAGVFLTSDCLSEEKREGTLGLLFLTDLKAYDIVLGKLAANSLHAFFGLLAIFPILGLTLLLGGVTGQEFARLALVFVTTLFFSLGLGLAISALGREAKQAMVNALLLLVFFAGIFPAAWWLQWAVAGARNVDFLLWTSPVFTYLAGFDNHYRTSTGPHDFWCSITTLFLLGLGGIIVANIALPRLWHEGTQTRIKNDAIQLRKKSDARKNTGFCGIGWADPMYWLSARDGSSRRMAMRVLMILLPVWGCALITSVSNMNNKRWAQVAFITAFFVAYGIHVVVKVLIAAEAGRAMNADRRSGAWELLLVTPLAVDSILAGQKKALRKHFWKTLAALCFVNLTMIAVVFVFPRELDMQSREQTLFSEMFLGGIVVLFSDFFALGWVGMWRGLKAKQHHRGVMVTLGQIMSVPWFLIFLLFFVEPNIGGDEGIRMLMGFWFAVGLIVDVISGNVAREKLKAEFRSAVLQGSGV